MWLNLLRAPAAPFVPQAWHGELVCVMAVCFSGDLDRVDEAMAPIRALGEPVFDLLAERPYTELQSLLDETEPKGAHYYWKTGFTGELGDDLLATARELAAECPITHAQIGVLHVGGALNEFADDDGAVGNRDARYVLGVIGMWEPGEARGGVRGLGARGLGALRPVLHRRQLHQLPDRRRRRGAHPRELRRQLRAAARGQALLRPGQCLPLEPQRALDAQGAAEGERRGADRRGHRLRRRA